MSIERFVIVDEVETNTLFFQVLLKEMGFDQSYAASDGAKGLELLEKKQAQFAIVSWEMESMPGTVFLQQARSKRQFRHLPCLIYSKRMSSQDLDLARELGFPDMLAMPFERSQARELLQRMLDDAANIDPQELLIRQLEDAIDDGRAAEALEEVDPSLNEPGPHFLRAQTIIANGWTAAGQLEQAETVLNMVLAEDSSFAPALHCKARLLSRQGKHQEAIAILQPLTEASPKNLTSMANLGAAYVDANEHEKAKDTFSFIADIDPDFQPAKDEQAKLAFKEGDFSLAEQLLKESESGAEMARFFNRLAISIVAEGNFQEGIETYHKALKLLSDKTRLHLLRYNLGLAHKKNSDLPNAFSELAASYLAEPTFEKAYAALARVVKDMKANGLATDANVIAKIKKAREKVKS